MRFLLVFRGAAGLLGILQYQEKVDDRKGDGNVGYLDGFVTVFSLYGRVTLAALPTCSGNPPTYHLPHSFPHMHGIIAWIQVRDQAVAYLHEVTSTECFSFIPGAHNC